MFFTAKIPCRFNFSIRIWGWEECKQNITMANDFLKDAGPHQYRRWDKQIAAIYNIAIIYSSKWIWIVHHTLTDRKYNCKYTSNVLFFYLHLNLNKIQNMLLYNSLLNVIIYRVLTVLIFKTRQFVYRQKGFQTTVYNQNKPRLKEPIRTCQKIALYSKPTKQNRDVSWPEQFLQSTDSNDLQRSII